MRITRTRCLAALITTTSLLGVSACGSKASTAQPITVPSTSNASPTGASSIAPSPSASDSPSVNPAEDVVTRLIETRDKVGQDPSVKIESLVSVSHDNAYLVYMKEFVHWREEGWVQKGDERIVSMKPIGKDPLVKVNTCIDVSATDLVDTKGKSVVSPTRPPRSSAIFTVKHLKDGWFVTDEKSSGEKC